MSQKTKNKSTKIRCDWVNLKNDLYVKYHDEEWGVPEHNDQRLFEFLILEGAQAGLSWEIILKKRENYRQAFNNFNPDKIANYKTKEIKYLLQTDGIIKNHLKIKSAIQNAKVFLEIQKEFGSFDKYIWQFTNKQTIQNKFQNTTDLPSKTELSETISQDLKRRKMSFVGPTIIYSFMQAIGMVNDHKISCFRYKELKLKNIF